MTWESDAFGGVFGQWPIGGLLTVTGAHGARLTVRATGTSDAEFSWDLDGDGVFEGSTLIPWLTLLT